MSVPTIPGVEARTVETERLTTRVLFSGPEDGIPVLLLHGNLSNATWWETTMAALPDAYRGIAPDQRGYGGADPEVLIDATNGMGDLSDDAAALLDTLGIESAHVVGNSMGGSILWRMMADHPARIRSAIQADPGSPYGYGGTRDPQGTPTNADFAGSGAGLVNPQMVERLRSGDMGTDDQVSPRNVFRALLVKPPKIVEREDAYVQAMLETHFGERAYPGDSEPSPNWPYVAPGRWGAANGLSPRWSQDPERILEAEPKPPVLWIRGADSQIISDGGPLDAGVWGPTGLVPGYPGPDAYPPQPMVSQIRAFLVEYEEAGGAAREAAIEDCGHIPFLEQPERFNELLHAFLREIDNEEETK
jgi:pimeloyl-ACP methyl ester carboxylesterase